MRFFSDPKLIHYFFFHQVVEPEKSVVTLSATKVEIKLKKRDALHWPSLELTLTSN